MIIRIYQKQWCFYRCRLWKLYKRHFSFSANCKCLQVVNKTVYKIQYRCGEVCPEVEIRKVFYMEEKIFEISAKEVTIEVVDEATGKTYRRTLPIDYYETANGLVLRGENLDGSISQLVFYTSRGMQRMQDLTGGGPDEDPCGGHTHG